MAKARILLVDDEPEILETTRWAFEVNGYEVLTARTGEEALSLLKNQEPTVILADFKLPKMSGVDFIRRVKSLKPDVPIIMISGLTHQSEEIEKECKDLGTFTFLHKPLRMEEVLEVVSKAIAHGKTKSI